MQTRTVLGCYGSGHTPAKVYCADVDGGTWYVVDGGSVVNFTCEPVEDGVDVELLQDVDCFTWCDAIEHEEALARAVRS